MPFAGPADVWQRAPAVTFPLFRFGGVLREASCEIDLDFVFELHSVVSEY